MICPRCDRYSLFLKKADLFNHYKKEYRCVECGYETDDPMKRFPTGEKITDFVEGGSGV